MNNFYCNTHGGDIYNVFNKYGFEPDEILDYSANINPLGVPSCIKEIILSCINDIKNYPDPTCSNLTSCISKYLQIDNDCIIAANGASEVLYLLFETLKLKKVLIVSPTFSEYEKAARGSNAEVEHYKLDEGNDFKIDIDELLRYINKDINALILCNPNNPTSTLINKGQLEKIIKLTETLGKLVVVDEAFIELTVGGNDNSVVDFIKKYENLFVIRAFTKIFAIPGLRLGYGVGSRELIRKMYKRKMPWSVNTFASMMGTVLQCDQPYLKRTNLWLEEEVEWFYEQLLKIHDLRVYNPKTNFILVRILKEEIKSNILRDRLMKKGILIRDAANFKFLDDNFVRFAIKDRQSNIKFLNTLIEEMR